MNDIQKATFGMGCFWCSEAIFKRLKGVTKVTSGYSGGSVENPSYEEVCSGNTGHAEVVQIEFEPNVVSYKDLLYIFWKLHDPTTLNKQGADVGTQYRSVIFYHDEMQKSQAEESKSEASKMFTDSIVTEIASFSNFYEAEKYHKDFYANNPNHGYCRLVIDPKIEKLKEVV